jgi:hypothetical protein
VSLQVLNFKTFSSLVVFMGDKETDVRKQQPQEMHNSELVSKLMGKSE